MQIKELQIIRGDTIELELVVRDSRNMPFNLENAKVFMTIKEKS